MNYAALKNEIETDSLSRGYAGMTDVQVADDLNSVYRTRTAPLTGSTIRLWAAAGRLEKLDGGRGHGNQPAREAAKVGWMLLTAPDVSLDLDDPRVSAMLDGLVSANIIDAADKQALIDEATKNISRAQELGLPRVRRHHIAKARG